MGYALCRFGIQTNFRLSPGYLGKYLKAYLDPEIWSSFELTYSDAGPEHIWDALLAMGALFRQLGRSVAAHFGFTYPEREDERVSAFIRHIRTLPKDAATIY